MQTPTPELSLRRLVHELNTPVGVCAMAASMLPAQMDGIVADLDTPAQQRLAQQLDEWKETVALVQSSLQLCVLVLRNSARAQAASDTDTCSQMDLHATVQAIAAIQLARRPEMQVHLQVQMDKPMPVRGDSAIWQQVLGNLLGNSLLHGFDGKSQGTIHISATLLPGNRVLLNYYDNGAGLSPLARERLFEEGFSTRLGRGGHGLGMGIVRDLVTQRMGGRLEVHHPAKDVHFSIEAPG